MNLDEYMSAIIAKNPALGGADDARVTMTCRGVRNLIRQAYQMGWDQSRQIQDKTNRIFNPSNPFDSIFGR